MANKPTQFTFPGTTGEALAARFDWPAGTPRAYALFAHCFTCSKDLIAVNRIAEALTARGFAVVRFDFTGLGASEGEFANTNFTSNVGDLVAAADHMRETLEAPAVLIGHSLGGAAVLAAAGEVPECRAVVTIGAPADPAHVLHNFGTSIDEIEAAGEARVSLAGRPFKIRKQFLDDVRGQRRATPSASSSGRCWSAIHRSTRSSASRTLRKSSWRRNTRRVSFPSMAPTIF